MTILFFTFITAPSVVSFYPFNGHRDRTSLPQIRFSPLIGLVSTNSSIEGHLLLLCFGFFCEILQYSATQYHLPSKSEAVKGDILSCLPSSSESAPINTRTILVLCVRPMLAERQFRTGNTGLYFKTSSSASTLDTSSNWNKSWFSCPEMSFCLNYAMASDQSAGRRGEYSILYCDHQPLELDTEKDMWKSSS